MRRKNGHSMRFRGIVYRAINPLWAREPLSGDGAARFGGRFNPKGLPALYTSLSPLTAIREANQVGNFQPITLISINLDSGPILDTRLPDALERYGIKQGDLGNDDWRERMMTGKKVPTHALALSAISNGFVGMITPSYAPAAERSDLNLVLWEWSGGASQATLVDDENRLT